MEQQPASASAGEVVHHNPLISLPSDALLSVLCRVPACQHAALRKTCKAIRRTLDSNAYASERSATGWAEVTARLVPGEELYDRDHPDGPGDICLTDDEGEQKPYDPDDDGGDEDLTEEERAERDARRERYEEKRRARRAEDLATFYSEIGSYDDSYGYHDITVDIAVDGVPAGHVYLVLVPRRRGERNFHEAADAHSGELQEVGWTLCDDRGRPKVRSIKAADVDGGARYGGFLHVGAVRIPPAHRPLDGTNVVAAAVRAALTVPELDGEWTLATAISDMNTYMTDEDKKRREVWMNSHRDAAEGNATDAARAEEKKWLRDRWDDCLMLDARTFLRVGCKQIPEAVGADETSPPWFFALPQFLLDPILSHEEAMAIKMHRPPDLPPDPTGVNEELLNIVKKACNARRPPMEALARAENVSRDFDRIMREENERELSIIRRVQELETMISQGAGSVPERVRSQMNSLRTGAAEMKRTEERCTMRRTMINRTMEDARDKIRRYDEDLKATVTTLVNEKGASIRKGFVLHCSSRFLITEYIDFLLELVPTQQRSVAINDVDTNGCTPLHCALMGTPELSDAGEYYRAVQHLLGLGASKDAVDPSGRTPLGQYRVVTSFRNDYLGGADAEQSGAEDAWRPIHQRMEEALMPIGGETDADKDAEGVQSDESLDDEEDFDMEDFEMDGDD